MSLIDQRVVNCKRNESFLCNKYLKVYESMKFVNRMKEECVFVYKALKI